MGPELIIDIGEKRFEGTEIPLLTDLLVKVAEGSVVALIGPSGVGKSTLLRMIAAVDRNFIGRILVGGETAEKAPPAGYVFQDARLLPWLSAIENVRAVNARMTHPEALELLRRVGLEDAADAFPRQLSGGMQRRVGLARALAVNSKLLLLDEPFVSLDRQLVHDLTMLFSDIITATAATAVMVTHLAEDAAMIADRAIILGGRPAEIRADIALSTPRRARKPADILAMTELLSAHL